MQADAALLELAGHAGRQAYAPYSRLSVGAAVLTAAGGRYAGCNVENAAYPSGGCAEQHAIAAAVQAEGPGMRLRAVAISASHADGQALPIPPCGACRQRIAEFGDDVEIVYAAADGSLVRTSLLALLPQGFRFPAPVA